MEQENKELLKKDLCSRLPYGVKLLVEGWDSDMGCEFTSIETLRGINDRFIYTLWDKTGDKEKHSIVEPLSILDYKPYLRPLTSMNDDEREEYRKFSYYGAAGYRNNEYKEMIAVPSFEKMDWLNAHHFDYRGLIEKGIALVAPEGMYSNF